MIALSTASVYPETTANGFELASRLGYDAVEVMVGIDPISIGAISSAQTQGANAAALLAQGELPPAKPAEAE